MKETMMDWRMVPLYTETAAYAREHGELETFRLSNRANEACKQAIERSIRENFDGMYLEKESALLVLHEFGRERMLFVLANTVQQKDYDGRFSTDNKAWAWKIPVRPSITGELDDRRLSWVVESHPAVLDGFIHLARKAAAEQDRPSILSQLHQPLDNAALPRQHDKTKGQER